MAKNDKAPKLTLNDAVEGLYRLVTGATPTEREVGRRLCEQALLQIHDKNPSKPAQADDLPEDLDNPLRQVIHAEQAASATPDPARIKAEKAEAKHPEDHKEAPVEGVTASGSDLNPVVKDVKSAKGTK